MHRKEATFIYSLTILFMCTYVLHDSTMYIDSKGGYFKTNSIPDVFKIESHLIGSIDLCFVAERQLFLTFLTVRVMSYYSIWQKSQLWAQCLNFLSNCPWTGIVPLVRVMCNKATKLHCSKPLPPSKCCVFVETTEHYAIK